MEDTDVFFPHEAATKLTELGVHRSASTLANERVLGLGPPFRKDLISRRVAYTGKALREFVDQRLADCQNSSQGEIKRRAAVAVIKATQTAMKGKSSNCSDGTVRRTEKFIAPGCELNHGS
jgi:hypothetical protein